MPHVASGKGDEPDDACNMGQDFRLWLEDQGLFPENHQPEEGAVRFYAYAKQRTLGTARYFSTGLLPVAVEIHIEPGRGEWWEANTRTHTGRDASLQSKKRRMPPRNGWIG